MLLLVRFFYNALLLIGVGLVAPGLALGGRYLILLEALLSAGAAHWLRQRIGPGLPHRTCGLIVGLSVIGILLLMHWIFVGVNLTVPGILALYLGAVMLEWLIPDRIVQAEVRKNRV